MRVEGAKVNLEIEVSRNLPVKNNPQIIKMPSPKEEPNKGDVKSSNKIDQEELKKIIEEIRKKMDYLNKYLRIDIDNQLEIPVIKIVEKDTERVIRQIPPDYMLSIMKRIDEMLGIIISERI